MGRWERNPYPWPQIRSEEQRAEPLALPGAEYDWKDEAPWHHRLYNHNTLASIRQSRRLRHPCAPKDSLDLALSSVYDHSRDSFLERALVCVQPDIIGLPTYRLLRNLRYVPEVVPARDLLLPEPAAPAAAPTPGHTYFGLRVGGTSDRRSPHSVKLGISSNHSATSNPGYSRKVDGTLFAS